MKKYIATFKRYNPQLGTSTRTFTVEARTLVSANKKARTIDDKCVYGSMTLESVVPA
ncbi:hypothetical protein [Bacteroides acidifaciens]|jgi:hypothetical protein|uniref:hypothetical protein n=1 Tax=Bacteroides acidifaciens TaxID=85831 RepID=UPI0025A4F821|nr:hypothetical protein [Bacteroides acidifaciens]